MTSKEERERYIQLHTEFPKTARRDKAFFNDWCIKIDENKRRGNSRNLSMKFEIIK